MTSIKPICTTEDFGDIYYHYSIQDLREWLANDESEPLLIKSNKWFDKYATHGIAIRYFETYTKGKHLYMRSRADQVRAHNRFNKVIRENGFIYLPEPFSI